MSQKLAFFAQFILPLVCNNTYIWKIHLTEPEQIIKLDFYLRLQNTKILP